MVCYNKLWKMLIDRGMTKSELRELVGMSTASLAKLGKNELVSMEIILRICEKLNCDVGDVMEASFHRKEMTNESESAKRELCETENSRYV